MPLYIPQYTPAVEFYRLLFLEKGWLKCKKSTETRGSYLEALDKASLLVVRHLL